MKLHDLCVDPRRLALAERVVQVEADLEPLEEREAFDVADRDAVLDDEPAVRRAQRQTPLGANADEEELDAPARPRGDDRRRIRVRERVELPVARCRRLAHQLADPLPFPPGQAPQVRAAARPGFRRATRRGARAAARRERTAGGRRGASSCARRVLRRGSTRSAGRASRSSRRGRRENPAAGRSARGASRDRGTGSPPPRGATGGRERSRRRAPPLRGAGETPAMSRASGRPPRRRPSPRGRPSDDEPRASGRGRRNSPCRAWCRPRPPTSGASNAERSASCASSRATRNSKRERIRSHRSSTARSWG